MTTATVRSARPGIGRSVPLENGENGFELGAQVLDGLGRERAACLRLQVPAAPILLDLLARPLDRVFLGVQQMLHQHDQLDLAPLIHPVAGPVLGGVQEADRKSTRLNSSHRCISYAVFCLKKKTYFSILI